MSACVILYSGGTDSTCAAALATKEFKTLYLLTFEEAATKYSPIPSKNVTRLRRRYPENDIRHFLISTDRLIKKLSYTKYFSTFFRHRFLLLSTPGFSSLSWHLRTIQFCRENGVSHVRDGMTRELLHLPGHTAVFRKQITELYRSFGIDFESSILDWPVPPDQRFLDRLIVDRHGFAASSDVQPTERTTGTYLKEEGVFPHANVKGSSFDQRMQHDCYPFVVFNIFVFWVFLKTHSFEDYQYRLGELFRDRIALSRRWLEGSLNGDSKMRFLFEMERAIS